MFLWVVTLPEYMFPASRFKIKGRDKIFKNSALNMDERYEIFDAETRFRAQASRGNRNRGLDLLDKIDRHFGRE